MTYAAPVRDIRFALEEIVAIDGLKATGAFDELSQDLLAAALEEAGRLAADVVAPINVVGDREGARLVDGGVVAAPGFKEAYAKYVEGGWQGTCFPAAYGGMGLPRAMALAVSEMVQAASMSFGLCPMLTLGAVEALLAHGSDHLRETYLAKLVSGEWTGAMNLTEPQSGSDLSGLRTKATPVGDGTYRLEGQKIFITWGDHDCAPNIVHLVLARLPDAPEGVKGVSLFLAPKFLVNADGSLGARNDLRAIGLEEKMGIHGSPTCTMGFGADGEGALAWLVGEENRGLAHMFTMMNSARVNVGVQGVAIAERAYQQALAYAKERLQGRGPEGEGPVRIIEHPDVRRMLMTMKAGVEAGRAICFATAVAADYAEHADTPEDRAAAKGREELLTPIAKAWCTDRGVEIASLNVQIHGGMGYVEETGAAQHFRDARIAPIYEGTNGVQAIDLVARKLPMDGGRALRAFIEDVRGTCETLALSSNDQLHQLAGRLSDATDAFERASDWMLAKDRARADVLAGATPYLKLAGDVAGGYFLCLGAIAAQRRLKDAEGDLAYAQSKIDIARFFADTCLAAASGLVEPVTAGAASLYDVPEAVLSA